MATQTRFDLNAAVENWRNELAAQPQLTPDDRRELDKHLADSMAELRGRGLNEEESFWLAQKRIGRPQQLAEEFHKVDVANVWRERVFWIWLALFLWRMVNEAWSSVAYFLLRGVYGETGMMITTALMLLPVLVLFVLAVLSVQGKLIPQFSRLRPLIQDRRRLAITTSVLILLFSGIQIGARVLDLYIYYSYHPQGAGTIFWGNLLFPILYLVLMGAVLIWLYPGQSQKLRTEKPA